MSLYQIVRAKGGDLYSDGNRASIPAPGHSQTDRSASLLISRSGRVIVYSFGSSSAQDILKDLRDSGLITDDGYPNYSGSTSCSQMTPMPTDADKSRRALELWNVGQPIAGTLSERYLQSWRSVHRPLGTIATLRHHPQAPVAVYNDKARFCLPALMSLITNSQGKPTAVELTYLDGLGRRNRAVRLSRKTVGQVPDGACVQLDPWSEHMVVGEGVITTLSASEHLELPGAALLGVRKLRRWRPPVGIRRVTIAADRGKPGETAANDLSVSLTGMGIDVDIVLPDWPHEDFNHMACASAIGGKRGGRGGMTGN